MSRTENVSPVRMQRILCDWQFYLCLLFGPISWLGMAFFIPVQVTTFTDQIDLVRWLMLIIIYPVLEEFVFRGLVLGWLNERLARRRFGLLSYANLLTSVLFVAVHFIAQPWYWALLVFFPSLVFGYLKERHNSLISPIILHSTYNLGFIFLFT